MERQEIQKKLDTLIEKVCKRVKDKDKMRGEIDDILSLKGQLDVEPMHFFEYEKDVIDKYEGDAFCIYKTERHIHYMTRGGYHIFVQPNYTSLYGTLDSLISLMKEFDSLTEDEKKIVTGNFTVMQFILQCPLFACGNYKAMDEIGGQIIKTLESEIEESMKNLAKEDVEKNMEFEDAVKGLDEMKQQLEKDIKDGKIKV